MAKYCRYCGSVNIIKYGKTKAGNQIYYCKDCGKYWVERTAIRRYPDSIKQEIISLIKQGKTVKQVSKEFCIPTATIYNWLRKLGDSK